MRKLVVLGAIVLALLLPAPFMDAESAEEDPWADPFADFSDDPFQDPSSDPFADLFMDEAMIEDLGEIEDQESLESGQAVAQSFLSTDKIEIGGTASTSLGSTWTWQERPTSAKELWENSDSSLNLNLSSDIYLDARPSSNFRFFTKFRAMYPFNTTVIVGAKDSPDLSFPDEASVSQLNIKIREMFTDIDLDDRIYLRFGKQTVNWGVGYFFSPADVISLVPIDPENPSLEREGPIALKASLPLGLSFIDAYLIGDEKVRKLEDIGLAARASIYLAPLSWELGVAYQKDRPLSLITTLRFPLGDFDLFAEGRLNFGRLGKKVLGMNQYAEDNDPHVSASAGFLYMNSDAKFTAVAQYLFHGEGYDDTDLIAPFATALGTGDIPLEAAIFGKHHSALSLGLTELFHEDLSANLLWQASWTDLSGLLSASLSWQIFDMLRLTGGIHLGYGERPSEYGGVEINLNEPVSLRNPYGRLGASLTLNFGTERF